MDSLKQTLRNYGIKRQLTLVGIEKTKYSNHTKVDVIFNEVILTCFILNYMLDKVDLIEIAIFNNLDKI